MKLAISRVGIFLLIALLQSCGGGGDSGGNPPPSGPNSEPVANGLIPDQQPVVAHPFRFDVSQSGVFSDPDGDRLTYLLTIGTAARGLSASGPVISGTPTEPGTVSFQILVTDGRGGELIYMFPVEVVENSPPIVAIANGDRVFIAGGPINHDVTQGGATFTDVDGDPLSYTLSFVAGSRGLSIAGTRVTGTLNSFGLARVRVVASDGFGGQTEDAFSLAFPAPPPGPPTLPSPTFVYADEELDLPYLYQLSRQQLIPFWDTTPVDNPTTNAGATLGRVLFHDKRVSITNQVSCSSCHEQARGFAKPDRFSVGVLGVSTKRNAMALANVRYSIFDHFFSDTRINTLESLVPMPIEDFVELGNPMPLLVDKLAATDFYPPLFEAAFGTADVTADRISKALAQFLRSLISYRSKFDQAFLVRFEGDIADPSLVFNAQEMRGLEVAGTHLCFHCHGDLTMVTSQAKNNGLDSFVTDPGAGSGTFRPASFKNIRLTGPYMHDGRFATLRQVIDFYDQQVQDSPHLDELMREQLFGPPRRMNLSEEDKDALEAFLDTMTDNEFITDPRFSDPFQ
jgi:cytochrome c peroxidase